MRSLLIPSERERHGLGRRACKYAASVLALAGQVGAFLGFSAPTAFAQQAARSLRLDETPALAAQSKPPITQIPEILKHLPIVTPDVPETSPEPNQPTKPPRDGADAVVPTPGSDLQKDLAIAERFRDDWLALAGTVSPVPTGSRWADFSYSIAVVLNQARIDPNKTETPSVVGTTVRSAIQLALISAFGNFGDSFGRQLGPRKVYDENAADQLARTRLEAMENAVREYLGPDQATSFRTAKAPRQRVQLASEAMTRMIAEQKAKYPNALLLSLSNPLMQDEGLLIIEKAVGRGPLYAAFQREQNPRIKSGYLADAHVELFTQLLDMARTGEGDPEEWLRNLSVDFDAKKQLAERTVLENLGNDGRRDYRSLRGEEKDDFFAWALTLEAVGMTALNFATLTPENIRKAR